MDTLVNTIFVDETAEYNDIQVAAPSIDLTDWPLDPALTAAFTASPNFYVTSAISQHDYFEIQFMLGSTSFWGCDMMYGNSPCGINIRQGISHLIDKTQFPTKEASCAGTCAPLDNPLPMPTANGGLLEPNPCNWDNGIVPPILAGVLGANMHETDAVHCKVGEGGMTGGQSYHLGTATGVNYAWQPSVSDLDFCAAAAHFIDAGLATGVVNNSPNPLIRSCVLTGVPVAVTNNPITFFVRNDIIPLYHAGLSVAQTLCALFSGSYALTVRNTCGIAPSTTNILSAPTGPSMAFLGFNTHTDSVSISWNMYTAHYSRVFPFSASLYGYYHSRFVSGISTIHIANGGNCSNASVPSSSAANYMYLCNPNYDALSNGVEFANCLSALGDPDNTEVTPTFGTCSAAAGGGLSALSSGYQAEDAFGQGAYTLPLFEDSPARNGYLACSIASRAPNCPAAGAAGTWQNAINDFGNGLPNYFTWLNAWNVAPDKAGSIRQGFKQDTRTVNPYMAETPWEMYILHDVYDSLHVLNPLNNAEDLSWMDVNVITLPQAGLTYVPPPGTVLTYRVTLMPNLNWQDGNPVTSFDVAFSYLSLLANGAFQSRGAKVLSGITILSIRQFDLNIAAVGPFVRSFLMTGLTVMPGRYWTCGTGTQPSTGVAPNIAPAPCPAAAASQWDAGITTCTSVGNTCYPVQYTLGTAPLQSACYPNAAAPCAQPAVASLSGAASFVANLMNVDAVKTGALYDPIASHIFIGSGPWTCGTGAGLGQMCTPGNTQNPPIGSCYCLTRNGRGVSPGFPGDYFRSSGFLASYLWSGDISPGVINYSIARACFGAAPAPLSAASPATTSCAHFQQGIGTNGAIIPAGTDAVNLHNDLLIKYVDNNGNNKWDPGEPVVYDNLPPANNNVYDCPRPACEPVIYGNPVNGDVLKVDPLLQFVGGAAWIPGNAVYYNANSHANYDTYGTQIVLAGSPCPVQANPCGIPEGSNQISIVALYININWVYPDNWNGGSPPTGIIPLDPVLHSGSAGTLSPASSIGCSAGYPAGGYDC
jgi:hypothetical protein